MSDPTYELPCGCRVLIEREAGCERGHEALPTMSERPGVVVDVADLVRGVAADIGRERRERIATAVLAGFAANSHGSSPWMRDGRCIAGDPAKEAVSWADALIAELEK